MRVAKQVSVMLPNKPGQLEMLCKKLAAARIDLRAVSVVEGADEAIVRFVADKTAVARQLVKEANFGHVVNDVLLIDMVNRPGTMAKVAAQLTKAGVNIQYVYGSSAPGASEAAIVFGVDDLTKAKKVLA